MALHDQSALLHDVHRLAIVAFGEEKLAGGDALLLSIAATVATTSGISPPKKEVLARKAWSSGSAITQV